MRIVYVCNEYPASYVQTGRHRKYLPVRSRTAWSKEVTR